MTPDPGQAIAHTKNALGRQQPLTEHLEAVSRLAGDFASQFGAEELATWLGRWHDIGKFNPAFQQYLRAAEADPTHRRHGPDHKAAGAQLAAEAAGPAALVVQGHHGGLTTPAGFVAWLKERAADPAVADAIALAREAYPALARRDELIEPPHAAGIEPPDLELFIRMLLSAVVDADRLDTERHFAPERAASRGLVLEMDELWTRFARNQESFDRERRPNGPREEEILRIRRAIYDDCLAAADEAPGLFRLTVPTGGGKTRSALAFALRHARRHGLRRVVVAVPFITITEQTADIYRTILESPEDQEPVVLEHHSGVDAGDDEAGDAGSEEVWRRLTAENWDASVVVTTTVQLFESLFANHTSPARKLHRLARSVIILDEAQALPPPLLTPALDVLRQLCERYGCTVVLSTATQPAFEAIGAFATLPAREIVPEPERYFEPLRRVDYTILRAEPLDWPAAADLLRPEPQALAVLNTKAAAIALLDALDDREALHLSTLLCGGHRRQVL
ncbi:MAG TPA: CRISPR-associated endonuclease Cas3'', partial [Nitrolancea sp.]|nr:CRISPR-associated endonuclease Cas3'' [Nitrolancea sp.]